MARKEAYVEVVIDEQGNIISEVHGVLGPSCEGLVDWMGDLGEIVVDRKTRDYGREPDQGVRTRVRAGG